MAAHAPQLRWNDLGGYPCRRGDLGRTRWNPCDVLRSRLIPEYGGSCAVRERAGQVAAKACGSALERPPIKGCNDVAVDRFGQACRFLASFRLPFALRGSSGEAITDGAWSLGPGKVRWHTVRSREPELPILKVRFFIGARISFSRMCAVTHILRFPRRRCR